MNKAGLETIASQRCILILQTDQKKYEYQTVFDVESNYIAHGTKSRGNLPGNQNPIISYYCWRYLMLMNKLRSTGKHPDF
ncbi:hypothetical protein DFO77_10163 [Marinilabilia salmonicolor]|jgi:hypothetical protein|uniref:Uncharacterized protein n=1 Tax=Marinilabilia salmonicolor TaxID=989 RepID=A0A2T0XQV3_9BACT|nr:hypothetical protein BY457_103121 [Marinilabilia salmonicolor]RCW39295.1 hypothetical protein DFO77_10163 [Marinilabilia salmonicolor]